MATPNRETHALEDDEALDPLRSAAGDQPEDPAPYVRLAAALADRGRNEEAAGALGAFDGVLTAAPEAIIRERTELAARLVEEVRSPAALGALARVLAEGLRADCAPEPATSHHLARALAALMETSDAESAAAEEPLPGGWRVRPASPTGPSGGTSLMGRVFRRAADRLNALALVLPLAVYGAALALRMLAGGGRSGSVLEAEAGLCVLPAAALAICAKILAWVVVGSARRLSSAGPGRSRPAMRTGVRAAAILTAACLAAAAAWSATWVGAPWGLMALYGALMGGVFVHHRIRNTEGPRPGRVRRRWLLRHERARLAVALHRRGRGVEAALAP